MSPNPSTAMFQDISENSEIFKFSVFGEELAHQNIEQLNLMGKLSSSLLFIKQWIQTNNEADKITVTREDYTLSKE